jgi:hypothetical protein
MRSQCYLVQLEVEELQDGLLLALLLELLDAELQGLAEELGEY